MTSIDDLFKKPSLPGNKRQSEAVRDPNELYKSIKLNANGSARAKGQAAPEDQEDEGAIAGPALPSDQEDGTIDDEEGRFFGGGIADGTVQVLNYIETREQDAVPGKIDTAWVRKLALNFEKRISKNAELRAKFEEEPQKFMGSEADLDADVKALSILSEHPELYEDFAKLGSASSLVSLLAHENADIAIDAIEIINELTDEDTEAEQVQWDVLVDAMLEADLLDLLAQNLSRLDEDNDSDRSGVYHGLSVLESLTSRPMIAELIGKNSALLPWLISRIQREEDQVGQNKQYAAEVLAILLQSSLQNRKQCVQVGGVDILLQLLSAYRKRDPIKGSEEEEYVENIFDCLTCLVDDIEGKSKFLEAEGLELCLIMLREGGMSKPRALRLVDHALGGMDGSACCERLVEAAGLKIVFSTFMKKHDKQMTEHFLGIFSSLLRFLPADSAARIRTLAKFVERDYEKISKLVQLRRDYAFRVSTVDDEIKRERDSNPDIQQEDKADEWLSRRLDAGLFSVQTIDVVLAWLIAEDDGARGRIEQLLADRDETLGNIKGTIQEQLAGMNVSAEDVDISLKDMLGTLIQFL